MRNALIMALTALALLALTACSSLSPEQKVALAEWARQQFTNGQITEAQYNAILDALEGGPEWWQSALEIVAAIIGSLFGVRVWRGSIVARKGAIPPIHLEAVPTTTEASGGGSK